MKFPKYILSFAMISGIISCSTNAVNADPNNITNINGSWAYEEIIGSELTGQKHGTISFNNGHISASAGCNQIVGEISGSLNNLQVGTLGMTKMFCIPNEATAENLQPMNIEANMARRLSEAKAARINGDIVTFFNDGGVWVLKLKRE